MNQPWVICLPACLSVCPSVHLSSCHLCPAGESQKRSSYFTLNSCWTSSFCYDSFSHLCRINHPEGDTEFILERSQRFSRYKKFNPMGVWCVTLWQVALLASPSSGTAPIQTSFLQTLRSNTSISNRAHVLGWWRSFRCCGCWETAGCLIWGESKTEQTSWSDLTGQKM